ncbi:response regulator [Acidicapsa dinghuensis]|uniref:Response regulator n=1 Tax=Acidicapsa dinghuensis TaxID=2218256 RepID=A0ABW1ELD0_9BACT|nr:response regulator [Acidicapsa dinghuensis]
MDSILLVDDNPLRASMRKTLLESSTPAVFRAVDAADALCLIESHEFARNLALVITGHRMTGISGPEFVAEVRSRLPQVPILVLSLMSGADQLYLSIPNVFISQSDSPEELRALAVHIIGVGHRQTA